MDIDKSEKIRISNRKYYLKNKENIIKRNVLYIKNHPEKVKEYSYRSTRKFSKTPKGFYKVIKRNSIKRNIECLSQLDFLEWYSKQDKVCIYCGINEEKIHTLSNYKRLNNTSPNINRLTIDRIDNKLGYIVNNIKLACNACNSTKADLFSFEEMCKIGKLFIIKKYICD